MHLQLTVGRNPVVTGGGSTSAVSPGQVPDGTPVSALLLARLALVCSRSRCAGSRGSETRLLPTWPPVQAADKRAEPFVHLPLPASWAPVWEGGCAGRRQEAVGRTARWEVHSLTLEKSGSCEHMDTQSSVPFSREGSACFIRISGAWELPS